jgi:hypothetical protein
MRLSTDELCQLVHSTLEKLPELRVPDDVDFLNGLYFFYQKGEASPHASKGRIVRVGNHPRSDDGLKRRLEMHYEGSKNSSVFRKFLGGAILRKDDAKDPCLMPAPGQGHWERQHAPTCMRCSLVEGKVSQLLQREFSFRCLEIRDRATRNRLEGQLIATLSLCHNCEPSDGWLGKYAYSDIVKRSGLWNSQHVFDQALLLSHSDLTLLSELVSSTLRADYDKR